jgi:predicted permease
MSISELWRRLFHLFRRDRATEELEEEMRLHVRLRADANRQAGMSADDAASAARRRFGNRTVVQETSRDAWGFGWLEHLMQDSRHAVRRLSHRRAFTLAVVGVLALGVGATTAMFSAVDAAMLRPLPFASPGRLVTLRSLSVPFDPGPQPFPMSRDHIVDFADASTMKDVFAHVAAYAAGGLNLSDPDRPVRINVGVVTQDFFATLGVAPEKGRAFEAEESRPNGPLAVILSHGLWTRQFGGRSLDGLTAQLNGKAYAVVGVMPPGFSFPNEALAWIPMTVPVTFATFEPFRGFLPSTVIARVASGRTLEAANARLRAEWERSVAGIAPYPQRRMLTEEYLDEIHAKGAVTPLQAELVGNQRTALLVLLGATGFLLLIACANVANLLLSHATMRRREIAVREVLGATRGRIMRQLLTESVLLAVTGAALGVAVAPPALHLLRALMPAALAGVAPAQIDLRVLAFATGLGLLTGIGFGLWPALGTTREGAGAVIKTGGGHGATAFGARRARRVLVGAELALALMLLVGAGLMLRSFQRLTGLDTGMSTGAVATLELSFPREAASTAQRRERVDAILARLSATPAIDAAGVVNDLPLRGGGGISLRIADPVPPGSKEFAGARMLTASEGYFRALGIRLLEGRTFTATDADSLAPQVAIISETMAKRFWPGTKPLGRTFRLSTAPDAPAITVIGVVSDVREGSLEKNPDSQMYSPIAKGMPVNVAIVVHGTLAPGAFLSRLVAAVREVDPAQAVYNVRMMEDVVGASVAPRRANTLLISLFAALALLLAALGVYAVVAYGVSQRAREFGIRTALGARGRDLLSLVAREMVWVTVTGLGIGLAGAWALTQVLQSLLYGVGAHDPLTFVLVPFVLVVPAAIATLVPARRALRVNPVDVMRAD